jgi:thiamine-phosphate pyrophosphorylase
VPSPVADPAKLGRRRLYLCTPDRSDLPHFLDACILGGVDVVQLRDKHLDARALLTRAAVAKKVCAGHGVPFILNDRPDLALECGADGVHVGHDDAPPALARRILGPDVIIGLSTHDPEQLDASAEEPVDYISVGPVTPTPTKPGRPGTGLGYVTKAASVATCPFFVTGGVNPETIAEIVRAGGRRFVVVRWLTEATDPRRHAQMMSDAIDHALATH